MSQGRLAFFSMGSFEDTEELITPAPRYHVFMCIEERTELSHNPRHMTDITARALVPLTWWQPIPVVQKQCQNTMRKRTGRKGAGGRRQTPALTEKEGQKLTKAAHCTQAVASSSSLTNSTRVQWNTMGTKRLDQDALGIKTQKSLQNMSKAAPAWRKKPTSACQVGCALQAQFSIRSHIN